MKSTYLYILAVVFALVQVACGVPALAATDDGNIVANAGFEDQLTGWSTWTPRGKPEVTTDSTVFHSGKAALRITGFQSTDRGSVGQRVTPEAGNSYIIRVWIKTKDVKPSKAYMRVQFNAAGSAKSRGHLFLGSVGGTKDWTLYEEQVVIPNGTLTLSLEPFLDSAQGTMWVDDIEVVPSESVVLETKDIQATTVPSGSVSLSWDIPDVFKETGVTYKVYRSVVPDFNVSGYPPVGMADEPTFYDRNTRPGQTLYYRIVPVAANGEPGNVSPTVQAVVEKVEPATTATSFYADFAGDNKALLTWDLGRSRARQVRLEKAIAGDSWMMLALLPPWMTEYTDETLSSEEDLTTVSYRLTVVSPDRKETSPVTAPLSGFIPTVATTAHEGEHPSLFISSGEIEQLQALAANDYLYKQLLQTEVVNPAKMAVAYSKGGVSLPEKGDNSGHYSVAGRAKDAALGYAFTGDEEMAEAARKYLVAYAQQYKNYPLKIAYDGRVTSQTLNESFWLINLAWAYDLIWNSGVLTAEDRQAIENDLLYEGVRVIDRYDKHLSNWQAWHNAAIGSVAFLLGDAQWIQEILTGPQSFTVHVKDAIRGDGMWWEQAIGYHNYTLSALTFLAEMAYCNGYDLYHYNVRGKSLKLMYDAPLAHAFSDGNQAAIGNTSYNSQLSFSWVYGLAAKHYKDLRYASLWRERPGSTGDIPSLFYLQDLRALANEAPISIGTNRFAPAGYNLAGSSLLGDTGMVVLRGSTPGPEVAMVYKPYGTIIGHQAADNLTIVLEGANGKWLPGPGSFDYGRNEQGTWYKQTVARNGVVVDEASQYPQRIGTGIFTADSGSHHSSGTLQGFVALPSLSLATATTDQVYDGVTMKRTVLVSSPYVIDRYQVSSAKSHQYDWVAHVAGDEESISLPETSKEGALGIDAGYQHIGDVRASETADTWQASWERSGEKLNLTMLGSEPTEVMRANGYGPGLSKQPMIIIRRKAKVTDFVTVMEEYAEAPTVKSVRQEEQDGVTTVYVERVSAEGAGTTTDRFAWNTEANAMQQPATLPDGARFLGETAFFRQGQGDKGWGLLLTAGTLIEAEGYQITSDIAADLAMEQVQPGVLAVTQNSAGTRRTTVEMPEPQSQTWVYALEADTLTQTPGMGEAKSASWDACPGVVYLFSEDKLDETTLQQFAVEFRF